MSAATPVGLPIGSPTPIARPVKRPPGARIVSFETCGVVTDIVALYLKNQVFSQSSRDAQESALSTIGPLLNPQIKQFRKAHATWLADGYPAGFPIVRDLDSLLSSYAKLHDAAKSNDLDVLPQIYTDLQKAAGQYYADTNPRVCEQ